MSKRSWLLSAFMVLILPFMILSILDKRSEDPLLVVQPTAQQETSYIVRVERSTEVQEMELDKYISSVIYAEMPASFTPEALKAQAVAIRTYTLRIIDKGSKHTQAHLCTESSCCQAFREIDASDAAKRIQKAVQETKDEVLIYDNELIEATYFSCSGGRTESALEVWGSDVPYLQAQDSPGEEIATHFEDTLMLPIDTFRAKLGLGDNLEITDITYTDGDGVKNIWIGGAQFTGLEIREKLQLRSTSFSILPLEDSVLITTNGYGHRVGMSQYGAEAMAQSGSNYKQILSHYYQNTTVRKVSKEELSGLFDKERKL